MSVNVEYVELAMKIRFGDHRKKSLFVFICSKVSAAPELYWEGDLQEFCADYGRCKRTVKKHLSALVQAGWVRIEREVPFTIRVLKVSK